jgi:hypothetical protein
MEILWKNIVPKLAFKDNEAYYTTPGGSPVIQYTEQTNTKSHITTSALEN